MKQTILSQIGFGFLGFSFTQFLSFLGASYPALANGAAFILLIMALIIVVIAAFHWITLKKGGYDGDDHLIIGFMPLFIIGGFMLLAVLGGVSLGGAL